MYFENHNEANNEDKQRHIIYISPATQQRVY